MTCNNNKVNFNNNSNSKPTLNVIYLQLFTIIGLVTALILISKALANIIIINGLYRFTIIRIFYTLN